MSLTLSDAWSIGRLDAHAQAALVADGSLQPQELVEAAALRIEDGDGALNAVSTRAFDHARNAAGSVDRAAPMAAVPYLLKASLAYPGFPQTSCSRSKVNVVADRAYPLAHRFDDAGMVPVGMSTMPEFGLLVSGEALLPGPTLNPWDPSISAGGSSTGAAVAVAAGLVPLAHASDAAGSIRVPSSNCGVVGFKPGRGMNVRARAAHLLDDLLCSDALIARSVRDAAWGARWCRPADAVIATPGDRRLRIGVCTEGLSGPAAPDVVAVVERTAALLADLGHEVRPAMPAYDYPALSDALATLWAYLGGDVADFIAATHPGEPLADLLEPWTLGLASHRDRIPAQHLADAYIAMAACTAASARFFTEFDILLSPVARTTPPKLGTLAPTRPHEELAEAFFDYTGFTPIQNITGEPSISLPVYATAEGIPVGAMLSAAQGGDDLVLRLAAEIEAAAPWADRWPGATAAGQHR
jgi:amidase